MRRPIVSPAGQLTIDHRKMAKHQTSWWARCVVEAGACSTLKRDSIKIATHHPWCRRPTVSYLSGQLLIRDYYAAEKLTNDFLCSSNIDANSRLCMAGSLPAIAVHLEVISANTYRDIDQADPIALYAAPAGRRMSISADSWA
jgi:assimilatory nitrate reductase catalytic subunit